MHFPKMERLLIGLYYFFITQPFKTFAFYKITKALACHIDTFEYFPGFFSNLAHLANKNLFKILKNVVTVSAGFCIADRFIAHKTK